MSEPLNVRLDASQIAEVVDRYGATQMQAIIALSKAANHAARLAQRMGRTRINNGLSISAAALRRRLKLSTAQGVRANGKVRYSSAKAAAATRVRAKAWFGFNPVDPFEVEPGPTWQNDVRTRGGGVVAGDGGEYRWDGAFIARRRKGTSRAAGALTVFMRRGKSRLPIQRQFASFAAKACEIISGEIFPHVSAEFYTRFEQELIKEMGRA